MNGPSVPLLTLMQRSTLNVHSVLAVASNGEEEWPRGSGFLIRTKAGPTFVTAAHVIVGPGESRRTIPWLLQFTTPPESGWPPRLQKAFSLPLPDEVYYFRNETRRPGQDEYMDMALCPVKLEDIDRAATERGISPGTGLAYLYQRPLAYPNPRSRYGFISRTTQYLNKEVPRVDWDETLVSGMKYLRKDADGQYWFKITDPNLVRSYVGASGAPIFNTRGGIVALVKGCVPGRPDIIRGSPLLQFLRLIGMTPTKP